MPRRKKIADNQDASTQQLNPTDDVILQVAKAYPTYNDNQIAKQVVKIGQVTTPQAVNLRLQKNTYLRGEINKLREAIKEDHSRTIFPLAHDRLKKALKNKDLHDKDVFPYVKLAYDKELSSKEEKTGPSETTVNIESLQVLINNALCNDS
jgi:NifB/MoaA-like Fe-S oxidoreductase